MIEATGTLLIALIRGERNISRGVENDESTPSTNARMNDRRIPITTRESVKATAFQNARVGRRDRRERSVLTGEGRKISSPTTAERIAHTAIHRRTAGT